MFKLQELDKGINLYAQSVVKIMKVNAECELVDILSGEIGHFKRECPHLNQPAESKNGSTTTRN